MKRIYYCLIGLLAFQLSFSQSYVDKWVASYSTSGSMEVVESATSSQGETYVLGTRFTGSDHDAVLVKFDEDGNLDWSKNYSSGYGDSEDHASALTVDLSDNVFILININPDEAKNSTVANGMIIQKYNASGILLAEYESVNDATVKFGNIGFDIGFIDHPSYSDIYVTTSRAATGGMGLEARLWRFDSSLNFEASTKYDSSDDDIPEQLAFAGSRPFMVIRRPLSLQLEGWSSTFASNEASSESRTYNAGSAVEKIVDASSYYSNTEMVVLIKLTSGSYRYRVFDIYDFDGISDEFTKSFISTYTLNDLTVNDNTPMDVYVTGSKTVSGHEELLLMKLNASGTIQYENLLSSTHGSSNSVGMTIVKDGTNLKMGGQVVVDGISYPGTATFDTDGNQSDLSPFYSGSNTVTQMVQGANGENILVGNSSGSLFAYAQCSGPPSVSLGEDIVGVTGSAETLGSTLPTGMTYEWSTGASSRTIEVTETGDYSVTVRNGEGCPAADEINVTFLAPPPSAPVLLQPVIMSVHSLNPIIQINWKNDDMDAVSHKLTFDIDWNPNPGTYFDAYEGANTSYDMEMTDLNGSEYDLRLASENSDNVSSEFERLTLRPCTDYDMSALETYLSESSLNGPSELTDAGGTFTYFLGGSYGSELSGSFFEWDLPEGWELNSYQATQISVAVPADANSGQVGIRIVNPCSGEATSYLTRQVYIVKDQAISFELPDDTHVGSETFDLGATASSGLAVTYEASPTDILEISNGMATPLKAGTVTVTASQAGNEEWNAATPVERTFTVNKGDDVIAFDALDNVVWNVDDFDLDDLASSKSGRQITWSGTDDEVAMVTSIGAVNPAKPGTITITASLGANDDWNAAINVQQTLTVEKADQTITFSPVPSKLETDDDFQILDYITVSSGLLPTVVSSQTSVADITGSVLNIIGPGTTTLTASQTGNDYYNPASNKQQSFMVEAVSTLAFSEDYPQFEHFIGSTYRLLLKLTETGSVYYIVEPDGSSEPTPSQIEAGKNASGSDAFKKGVVFDLAAETENNAAQISGLTEGASYDIYLVLADESYALQSNVTKLDVTIEDNTAPEWSEGYPQMGTIASLEADVEIDLNEETGTVYYAVFSSSSTTVFPANLKNGNNFGAIDEGSVSASASGFTLTGLTEDREYDVWLVAEDADENLQSTAYKIDFTTIDDIAPEFVSGFPDLTAIDETAVDIEVKINEGGTVYAVAQLSGEMAPTFGQVKVGNNSSGSTAISANSLSVTKNELGELSLTGLTSEVAYDFYVVAEDDHSNSSGTPIKLSATTADLKAPTITPTYLTEVSIASTEATFSFSLDEEGTFYYVLDGSIVTSPSPAQVKAGKTENDEMAQISGSKVVNSVGVDQNITISGLNPGQEYELYYVAEDGIGNISASTLGNTFRTEKLDQTITFEELPTKVFGDANFNLEATASSGLTVNYSSSDESVATVLDNTVTIVGAGTTTITAMQSGDDTYNSAEHVLQGLVVSKATQTIDFTTLETKTIGDAAFELVATGGASGNQVTFSSSNENVATVSGNTVTIVGAGITTITASQAGNANYETAVDVAQELVVEAQVVASVGIDAFVKIYPNPTSDYLTITGRQLMSATLYDLSGSQMKEWAIGDKATLDLGQVPDGVYLLRLVDHEGASKTHRIKMKN